MKTINVNAGIEVHSVITCYLCGAEGSILYGRLHDQLFGAPGEWNERQCSDSGCGLIWLDPMPTEASIHKVYTTYYTHQVGAGEIANVDVWRILPGKLRTARKFAYLGLMKLTSLKKARFDVATMYLARDKPGRLLEVGCGSGVFLDRMRSRGWGVQGIEVDPKAAKAAREAFGVPVYMGNLEEANYPSACFDAVTMNHVIEHVHDPIALLQECHRVLKPGGQLVVVTPNVRSFGHMRFGRDWRGLEPPRHLHLFCRSTLKNIANKAGFRTVETWTTPANAEVIALESFAIQFDGQHIMGSLPSLSREVISEWFQWRALAYYRKDPGSGEEVILKASR
jgi:2-polyprenyl-3-methyl-5-hydroxy-6-metoxy-1,4-benzoquinol methylase